MSLIKIWFPKFYTEYHRRPDEQAALAVALLQEGIDCSDVMDSSCQLIFCGSFFTSQDVKRTLEDFPGIPVIYYNWDIYPFQIENQDDTLREWWKDYLELLKGATEILVPSRCTIDRTQEYTGRSATVVKSCVHPWEPSKPVSSEGYIVNVMRRYNADPNVDALSRACDDLKIPLIEPGCQMDWEEFKNLIARARFLVSPYYEASTGGMTLLEGYYHGKSSLIAKSPRNGAVDYFGERAWYFQWDSVVSLKNQLKRMWEYPPRLVLDSARAWLTENYSEARFAKDLASRFRNALSVS